MNVRELVREINSIGLEATARAESDHVVLVFPGVWPEFERRAKERARSAGRRVDWPGVHARAKEAQSEMRHRVNKRLKTYFGSRFTKVRTRRASYWEIDDVPILRDVTSPKPSKIVVHADGSISHRQH